MYLMLWIVAARIVAGHAGSLAENLVAYQLKRLRAACHESFCIDVASICANAVAVIVADAGDMNTSSRSDSIRRAGGHGLIAWLHFHQCWP